MSKNQEVASAFVFSTKFLALKNDRICKKIIHGFCTTIMHHFDAAFYATFWSKTQ